MDSILSTRATLVLGVIAIALFSAYQYLRPRPLPGIPYNRDAAGKLFGDAPEMMRYVMRTKRIYCWLVSLTTRHQSPIVQAFIKPGGKPWVIVTDPFESQDIMQRRGREFDRSEVMGQLTSGILPEQHLLFVSTDERFRRNRNLINHLMAPTFIAEVSGPEVYRSVATLLRLWHAKSELAGGHAFSGHHDITYAALDAIFASSFGLAEADSNTIQRIHALEGWKVTFPNDADEPVEFPEGSVPSIFSAILTLAGHIMDTQLSPAPELTSWVLRQFPYMRRATAVKDKYIRDNVDEYVRLMEQGGGDGSRPRSALHSVLLRERDVAAKEGRAPAYRSRAIADEFFGFMMAGHDTTATAVAWGAKLMTEHQAVQARLRGELRAALPAAAAEGRRPTYAEIVKADVPYLDAVVDEVLRHANVIAFIVRQAQQDSVVLGRRIPKGTNVFLMANGPGYLEPNLHVDDEARSPGARRRASAKSAAALTGAWDDEDIGAFRPERWLRTDPDTGAEAHDAKAGPSLPFGLGLRSCFGRRLALQALRIHFGLIFWEFEMLPTPAALGGFEAVQRFAREPAQCYVRLRAIDL